MPAVNTSLYLDTRRVKNNGTYPLKLMVYHTDNKEQVYYRLNMDLTKEDFERSYLTAKPRQEFKELKKKLEALISRADRVIDDMEPFTFKEFEKRYFTAKTDTSSINYHYQNYMQSLKAENRVGTLSSYNLSLKSIMEYYTHSKGKGADSIQFADVTTDFLAKYETWMLQAGKSRTTVGIYLRPLRAIFNLAIEERDIAAEVYPFGKRRYTIPSGRKVKKALDKQELKTLFEWPTESPYQIKARDYFFFSYCCNGMNVADILDLRNKDVRGDIITFTRNKTQNTNKANSKPIIVPLNGFAVDFLAKYRSDDVKDPEGYVFPVLDKSMDGTTRKRLTQNFTKFINQHIKRLATDAGVTAEISSNWGRHSFATNAIRSGASIEFIQESLGHTSTTTTQNYFGGFAESAKKDISDKLMDFTG